MKVTAELIFLNFSLKRKIMIGMILVNIWIVPVYSKVTGEVCSNCHTMHSSQNGQILSSGVNEALLMNDCKGCHTTVSPPSSTPDLPYVIYGSAPTYNFDGSKNTLAGGNFYWVSDSGGASYKTGHNVYGISGSDTTLSPPGFNSSYTDKDGNVLGNNGSWDKQLRCAGAYGCHGKHDSNSGTNEIKAILGAHHADDSTVDGSTVGKSFRFLYGIKGTEDSDWEYTVSSSDHNGYYAVDRAGGTFPDKSSINYLCAECHGDFHSSTSIGGTSSPWLRHPIDYDLNNVSSGEYSGYPKPSYFSSVSSQYQYFTDVPLGNDTGSVKSTVLQSSNDAIILCISCHRAHGSPYKYILRWDYVNWPNGSLKNGCFACHSAKD